MQAIWLYFMTCINHVVNTLSEIYNFNVSSGTDDLPELHFRPNSIEPGPIDINQISPIALDVAYMPLASERL